MNISGLIRPLIVDDWKKVSMISYTVWLSVVGLVCLHASDILFMIGIDTNPASWTWILTWIFLLAPPARLLKQGERYKWRRRLCVLIIAVTIGSINGRAMAQGCQVNMPTNEMLVTTNLVKRWEGEHKINGQHVGYLDTLPNPDLPTACYGHTETAVVGKIYTQSECDSLLADDLITYRNGIRMAMTQETLLYRLTDERAAAFTSLAYNCGIKAISRSTALRRLNRGDIKGGCEAIGWWNKSGGRVVRGLVRRRRGEVDLCLKGLRP